jgi:DNA polymerase-3 subunit beta
MTCTETTTATATVATTAAAIVNTKDFTREMEWTARFADRKATIPILQNVAIRSTSGRIELTATDLETAGITSLEADGGDFATTVPASMMLKYLKKVTDAEIMLSVDGDNLTISHGDDAEVTINGMSLESYPVLPTMPRETLTIGGLAEALPRAITAISTEDSRFTLCGALLEVSKHASALISTDGHRLSLASVTAPKGASVRTMIPKFALSEMARLDVDSAEFATDENHAFFGLGKRTVITRKLTGNFPDWQRVMPRDYAGCATVDADAMRKHGDRVALFACERSHAVKFTLADNKLTISAAVADAGKARASVATTWERPEWASGFNWQYIADFLKLAPKTAFDMRFALPADGQNTQAASFDVDGWQYVVMPMRF